MKLHNIFVGVLASSLLGWLWYPVLMSIASSYQYLGFFHSQCLFFTPIRSIHHILTL